MRGYMFIYFSTVAQFYIIIIYCLNCIVSLFSPLSKKNINHKYASKC